MAAKVSLSFMKPHSPSKIKCVTLVTTLFSPLSRIPPIYRNSIILIITN